MHGIGKNLTLMDTKMIDLYYWPTPNGEKIALFLEETQLPYRIVPINIHRGDQFKEDYLAICPNNKVPAIVDHDTGMPLFESGAILVYLAQKTQQFMGQNQSEYYQILQWLFWQVGGLGPMAGQNHHFTAYAPIDIPYAKERYQTETARLYRVLNQQLTGQAFIVGDHYSIADMACFPWIKRHERQCQDLNKFPALKDWFERISQRPATERVYALNQQYQYISPSSDEQSRQVLFGQK